MKKTFILLLVFLISLLSFPTLAADSSSLAGCIYYFHGAGCEECEDANIFIDKIKTRNSDLQIEIFEVYQSRKNEKMLENLFTAYDIPKESRGIPIVFAPGNYFIGPESINELVEGHLKENNDKGCPTLDSQKSIGVVGDKSSYDVLDTLGFFEVTSSAIKDSFRRGMISLLLILIVLLLFFKEEHKVIERGTIFVVVTYFVYLLFSFGLFTSLMNSNISLFFSRIVAVIVITISLFSIRGFFHTWKRFINKIPEKYRKNGAKYKEQVLSQPGVIVIALVASILSISGMDQIFLILRSLITEEGVQLSAIPLLFYYALLLVLPLIAIVLIFKVAVKLMDEKATEKDPHSERKINLWRKHMHKIMNLIVSVILLIIGLVLLFLR